MLIYCPDCNSETAQNFIGVNPHNELHIYHCECCDNQNEVSEDCAEFNQEWQDNNS